jgi:CheY-like chemotaxis protein
MSRAEGPKDLRSEEQVRRSEALLAAGQRLSVTGSFSWNVVTDEITWSDQLYRIYELEIGLPVTLGLIRTRVHPEDVSLLEKMRMIDQAREGSDDFEWQYRLMMPDHSTKYMHAVACATRDQDGQREYIAAVQDVTRRRLSEDALAKVRREIGKVGSAASLGALTAAIAHEVSQPLSGIITNAGTCLRMLDVNPPNVDGARETARRIIRDSNRATDLITQLRGLFDKKELTSAPLSTRHRDEAVVTGKRSLVAIVDDDESVRESLPDLLRQFGFAAEAFSSSEAFLASDLVNETSCLLLDVAMPGMSGPDLQHELTLRRQPIPIVFITASGDRTLRSRLLAKGAVECLFKPFSETALLDALNAALRTK